MEFKRGQRVRFNLKKIEDIKQNNISLYRNYIPSVYPRITDVYFIRESIEDLEGYTLCVITFKVNGGDGINEWFIPIEFISPYTRARKL